jgi:hypothetical protein
MHYEAYSQNGAGLLNSEITEDEVIKAVKNLKNSKAPGLDDIVNEYLKTTVTKFLPYSKLCFKFPSVLIIRWIGHISCIIMKLKLT